MNPPTKDFLISEIARLSKDDWGIRETKKPDIKWLLQVLSHLDFCNPVFDKSYDPKDWGLEQEEIEVHNNDGLFNDMNLSSRSKKVKKGRSFLDSPPNGRT